MSRASSSRDHVKMKLPALVSSLTSVKSHELRFSRSIMTPGMPGSRSKPAMLCRQPEVSSWHETDLNYEAENVW